MHLEVSFGVIEGWKFEVKMFNFKHEYFSSPLALNVCYLKISKALTRNFFYVFFRTCNLFRHSICLENHNGFEIKKAWRPKSILLRLFSWRTRSKRTERWQNFAVNNSDSGSTVEKSSGTPKSHTASFEQRPENHSSKLWASIIHGSTFKAFASITFNFRGLIV